MAVNIVGGDLAKEGEFPWVVFLDLGCGGALYSRQIVLTASHCVGDTGPITNISMVFGTIDTQSSTATRINSTDVYNQANLTVTGDWALIKLASPAPEWIPTLPIATDDSNNNGMFTVVGWGDLTYGADQLQRYLRRAEVPHVDDATCAKDYPPESAAAQDDATCGKDFPSESADPLPLFNPAHEICAGFPEGGVDHCNGDSGGPAVHRDANGNWIQVGIVSWALGCACPGKPGVYTKTSAFAKEIAAQSAKLEASKP
ncbi:recombinant trypsin [Diaporthe sp. PMI_573]|nr:recombinant trypsin [Diaporthaceae sp. PMI_573]